MSKDDRTNVNVSGVKADPIMSEMESRAAKKARIIAVRERGLTTDRLHVDLPPHLYGEWVPNDEVEINRMRSMGFEVDTEYAVKRSLHGDGISAARVGDVIFMVGSREDTKDIIDEIAREDFKRNHGTISGDKIVGNREERESSNALKREGIPTIDESETSIVGADEVTLALESNNS